VTFCGPFRAHSACPWPSGPCPRRKTCRRPCRRGLQEPRARDLRSLHLPLAPVRSEYIGLVSEGALVTGRKTLQVTVTSTTRSTGVLPGVVRVITRALINMPTGPLLAAKKANQMKSIWSWWIIPLKGMAMEAKRTSLILAGRLLRNLSRPARQAIISPRTRNRPIRSLCGIVGSFSV